MEAAGDEGNRVVDGLRLEALLQQRKMGWCMVHRPLGSSGEMTKLDISPTPLGPHISSIHGNFSLGSLRPGQDRCTSAQ